jgi:hypothetical protein
MKKLLLSVVAVAGLAFGANAQTEKGKVVLGGSVGFNTTKVEGAAKSNVSFNVIPSVGYFVGNNVSVGLGIGYDYDKANSASRLNQAFVLAPNARYYVNLSEQFKFFGQLSVPMQFGNTKALDANGDTGAKLTTTTSIGVNVAPGFAFFPTKRIGIEVSVNGLGYNNYESKNEATGAKYTTNSFGLEANTFAPKLGVNFFF